MTNIISAIILGASIITTSAQSEDNRPTLTATEEFQQKADAREKLARWRIAIHLDEYVLETYIPQARQAAWLRACGKDGLATMVMPSNDDIDADVTRRYWQLVEESPDYVRTDDAARVIYRALIRLSSYQNGYADALKTTLDYPPHKIRPHFCADALNAVDANLKKQEARQ